MASIDVYENIDAIMENGADLIQFYRNNPVIAAYDLLKVDLAPIQRIILTDMWFKNYSISVCGRGAGKTFLLGLNAALHALLYPGYRVGLLGPSFRQCFFNDFNYLPIFTNKGMITSPIDFYDSVDNNINIQSLENPNRIVNKWLNDEKEGLIVKTQKGFEIGGLLDHKILVLDDNMDLIYKELQYVTKKDNLVIKKGFELFGNDDSLPEHKLIDDWRTNSCVVPKELASDISYLFGLIVGDGCISYTDRKYRVNLTSEDNELIRSFKSYMDVHFGIDQVSDYQKENNTRQVEVYNKNLCDFLIKCGFTTTTSLDKKIPIVINKASKENVAAFLSGLMDTDGGVNIQKSGCTVDLSTSSLQIAKEVQAWFLNFGMMSSLGIDKEACILKLNNREKDSICATSYKVRITNVLDMIKFRDIIGFRLERKKNLLEEYISSVNMTKIKNSYVVPNCEFCVKELVMECTKLFKYGDIYPNKFLGYFKNKFGRTNGFTEIKIKQLLQFAEEHSVLIESYYKLKKIIDLNLAFVKPKEFVVHKAKTIDIEVENESCYFAGGFINHNSKMIFAEVEKLYQRSSILREATEKKPTRGADTCFLKFKGTDISNGSYIEALPIGVDGAKIRGSRFYLIEIDELAQMPSDVIDMVIRPMAAVHLEPMQKVREIERIEQLIKEGLATEDDLQIESGNKMIMTSSGYFKFNHMWHRMKSYWKAIREDGKNTKYAVHQIPYQMLPKGFLDMSNVDEARRTMSSLEFMMEYEAAMASDSEGFFKASLLEACTRGSDFTIQLRGEPGKEYLLGIDPNQGGSALFGLIVIELGYPNKIVYVKGLKKQAHQEMTKAVQRLLSSFNIKRIYMDAQGGGNAIKDLLAEGYNNSTPILDMDDDLTKYKAGRRILKMINFSPTWISDANFDTLSLLENNRLRFPNVPRSSSEVEERMYEQVKLLKSQMLNIIVTETSRGVRHFDTPKKGQNKDLYSALILAAYGAKELSRDLEYVEPKLESSGLVRPHRAGASFVRQIGGVGNDYLKAAVLERKL